MASLSLSCCKVKHYTRPFSAFIVFSITTICRCAGISGSLAHSLALSLSAYLIIPNFLISLFAALFFCFFCLFYVDYIIFDRQHRGSAKLARSLCTINSKDHLRSAKLSEILVTIPPSTSVFFSVTREDIGEPVLPTHQYGIGEPVLPTHQYGRDDAPPSISVLCRAGSSLSSIYADVCYIDDVIASLRPTQFDNMKAGLLGNHLGVAQVGGFTAGNWYYVQRSALQPY